MKIAPEITYRDVRKTEALETLVEQQIAKLERYCNYMNSCRVSIEKTHDRPSSGSPYRVRIDITLPPNHELAVAHNPGEAKQYEPVETVIREAFEAARRQVVEQVERQREYDTAKTNSQQPETQAVVTKLVPESEYGFIRNVNTGCEVYFEKNSVSNNDFDRLEVGTSVIFSGIEGEMGPQATMVQIIDRPGDRVGKANSDSEAAAQPLA